MDTITLPANYGLVLVVACSSFFVNTYHVLLTSKFRKASGLVYPAPYASNEQAEKDPKAYAFNCAQRAHSNFTENHPSSMGAMLIAGLKYPQAAAMVGTGWVVARIIYAAGYTSGAGPKGRSVGSGISFLTDFIMKGMAAYTAVTMVMES
ncbi:MAPEG family protein [Zalerion maritima]|uniref:MAPEG family protein n=1 Tax=Zalerion maritima TaxID=339359 RepID=A0AAD5WSR6_9PEZI|nr:MAPEG family protein [Zalerion maritima]